MLFHTITSFFLFFSNFPGIILLGLLASAIKGRHFFFQTLSVMTLSIIVNVALKGTFHVPLSPALHKVGYAFPSGHMQMATVFYGWLMWHFSQWWWRVIGGALLIGIAISIVLCGYHEGIEVLAGALCGAGVVSGYVYVLNGATPAKPMNVSVALWLWMFASLCMGYSEWIDRVAPHRHAWVAYGVLCLVILVECAMKPSRSR